MSARGNGTSFSTQPWQNCSVTLNGTSNSSAKQLYGTSAGPGSDSQGSGVWITDPESTTNAFSNNEIFLPNYLSSSAKLISVDNVTENNGSDFAIVLWTALYSSVTTAVTSITIAPVSGSFLAYSTFSLYGIASTTDTPAIAPKAIGGNIVANDGTYWYHAFLTSGTFTPQISLSCDALVIAGGGSGGNGGNSGGAGGGGAGGLLYFSSQSLTAQPYTCTVGAGGAAVATVGGPARNGNTGNDSQLGSLTLVKGGGYGGGGLLDGVGSNGGNGGSGGGAGRWSNSAGFSGGTATAGQGNNGGGSTTTGGGRGSGGGGGAGAVGATGVNTSNNDGAGGAGLYYDSFGAATLTGQYTNSHYYYAGGGGGSSIYTANGTGGAGGGGAGPQAANTTQTATSGTANTGGGGGGMGGPDAATYVHTSGAGGSGIIIIRYAM
jgi:hypothetical protein